MSTAAPTTLLPAEPSGDDDGPPWLHAQRRAAHAALAQIDLPSAEDEVWRYSAIDRLDLTRYAPVAATGGAPSDLAPDGAAARIEVRDGMVVARSPAPAGVTIESARQAGDELADSTSANPGGDEYVTLLARVLAPDAVVVRIDPGRVLDGPIVIESEQATPGAAVGTRVIVRAGADSEVTVVERRHSGRSGLTVHHLDVVVDDAARYRHIDVQLLEPDAWQLAQQTVAVGAQATAALFGAGLGGDYARMRTDCRLVGRGASAELAAVSFGRGHQVVDYRTFQEHAAPDTTSDLLFKGAVDDEARSVYSGLIRVRPEARGTSAFQTNRNIKLSETAWAESVPNLEIETNDVRCSHASTVGPIDEDQRFYLESRGVPPVEAERLILAGFFDEVLRRVPEPSVAAELVERIGRRLEAVG